MQSPYKYGFRLHLNMQCIWFRLLFVVTEINFAIGDKLESTRNQFDKNHNLVLKEQTEAPYPLPKMLMTLTWFELDHCFDEKNVIFMVWFCQLAWCDLFLYIS